MNAITTADPRIAEGRSRAVAMAPKSISEAMTLAEMLSQSSMVPQAYRGKPQDIFVAVMWGAEVNLGPLQALNGVSVINGKPALWGDAALALVRGHPACVSIREGVEGEGDEMFGFCEVTRRGQAPERRTFSVKDARKAGLWGKAGPWTQYPSRMLQMRARGFAIRDVFPDALRGVITAEEAQDMPTEPREVRAEVVQPAAPALAQPRETTTARSFSFELLDDQLSQFVEIEEIRAYLAQPKVIKAREKIEARGEVDRWSEIVQKHMDRVLPDDETTAPNEDIEA